MLRILVSYRGIPDSPGWATGDLVANAFRALGHDVSVYGYYYQKRGPDGMLPKSLSYDEVIRQQFDLALYMEMNDGDAQYAELKNVKARVRAYWDFDVSYHPKFTLANIRHMKFDHIFYANPDFANLFQMCAPRISVLPYAFCSLKHVPKRVIPFRERKYKFAIIGSPWEERVKIVETLQKEGLDAHLITNKFREEYIEALNDTQVSINYNVNTGRGLLVMRVWESLGTHTCLLTNGGDHIEDFLTISNDCLVYNNDPELIDLCHKLNDDLGLAEKIARSGYTQGHLLHTYNMRAMQILDVLDL